MRWSSAARVRSRTIRTLLQQVQFQSSSDNPTDFSHSPQRTLTWAVTDSASVTTATTTINIVAVNDAPQETVAATAAYTENGSPVTISPAATASDVDNTDLIYGEVRIVAGGFDGDILTVNGLQSGTFLGIDFSYDAGLRRLLFNNPAAVADYQALMQAVGFGSTSENPTNFGANPTRTLGWGLSDGENFSASAQTTQITITALNDAPVNTVPGAQTVAEDSILPIVGVSVADIDSSALTTTLSVANGILNVTAGRPGVSGNGTASVTITGTAAQINAALVGLAYTGNLNFNGADTITVATSDGTATDTDLIAITVNPVNDPPINTVPGAQSVAEDTILPIAGVSVADIDSSALTTTLNVSSGTLTVIRRRRRHRQRQRQRNHRRHGRADQRGAGGPRLYRQPQLQRRRHAHGRDQRRDRHRHRPYRDHCQSSERRPGQYRAGRAERRRGHHPADRRRLGGGHRQQRAHHHAVGRSRHPQCDPPAPASPATAAPA